MVPGTFSVPVIHNWSRQSPVREAGVRMSGKTVGRALDGAQGEGLGPRLITVDHGREFQSLALEDWADRRGMKLDCIQRRPHSSLNHQRRRSLLDNVR